MNQRYKTFVMQDFDLGLTSEQKNIKGGLAEKFYNVNCCSDKICSANMQKDFFELVEPTRMEIVKQVFKNIVGDCLWITGFSTHSDIGKELNYIVFCNSNYKIYYYELGLQNPAFVYLNNITFTSEPIFEYFIKDNKNHLILCSQTDDMWVWNGINEPYQVLDAPCVKNMAVGFNRLFVTTSQNPYSVLFSSDLDPSNWSMSASDAGEVRFNDALGKVLSVFAIDNYIFVMRERGIVKLYNYNSNTNTFTISQAYLSASKIYSNSIAVCGDKIIFVCDDGIYSFDGLNGKKLYGQLNDILLTTDLMCAACVNNKYYLCANVYEKCNYNNALIVVDLQCDNISNIIMGDQYDKLCTIFVGNIFQVALLSKTLNGECNLPTYVSNCLQNFNEAEFLYKSKQIDLKPEGKIKTLSSLTLKSLYDLSLIIYTDKMNKKISVKGSPYFQKIKLGLLAHNFSFKIVGCGDVCVQDLTIDYTYVE